METAPRDFDAMTGRTITRGLEGLMFQCVLNTDHKRIYDVFEGGKGTPKLWTLTIERYVDPTPALTAFNKSMRARLHTPDRRKKARS